MEHNESLQAVLFSAAFAMLAVPALALAQVAPAGGGGSFSWVILLVVAALGVAIVWFTISQRRGAKHTP